MGTNCSHANGSICRRLLRRAAAAACLLLFALAPAAAQEPEPAVPFVERSEEEILILAVRLNNRNVSAGIIAYQLPEGSALLPIGELARLTTLAVEVDPDRAIASGFIIREEQNFVLNAAAGTVTLGEETQSYPSRQVEVHEDDIYVTASLLETWWPVEIDVDLPNLMLRIESTEPLPYELRQKRDARGRMLDSRSFATGLRYPLLPDPYSMFQAPVLNIDTRMRLDSIDGEQRSELLYTLSGAGDLLRNSARFFISGTDEDPFDLFRGTIGRWDPDGQLLGPLGARLAEVGEVQNPGSELLLRSTTGPGFHVSNYPLFLQDRLESHTFRGDIPPGWEVELYQNEVLVGFDRADAEGQYEFEEIPLIAGLNLFRLVFYGPRGETREEIVRFNLLDTVPERGELLYRAVANDARSRDDRALVEAEYGLGSLSSINVAAAYEKTLTGEDATYVKAGMRKAIGAYFLTGSVASDDDRNVAAQVRVNGRIGRWNVAFDQIVSDDFVSEDLISPFGEIESRSEAAIDGSLGRIGRSVFNSRLELTRDEVARGVTGYSINHRLSTNVQRFFISNLLDSRWSSDDATEDFTRGVLLVSRPTRELGLRGEIGYDLEPSVGIRNASLTADVGRWRPFLLQVGVDRIEVPTTTNQIRLNLQRRGRTVSWGFNVIANDDGDTTALATASTTLFFEPGTNEMHLRGDVAQGTAALSVHVFLDEDRDGLLDPGEPLLPDVEFFVGRLSYREATDEHGQLLITNLAPFRDTEITLSRSSLPDPTMVPAVEGHAVRLRPGRTVEIAFPVLMTGEINGTIYGTDGEPRGGVAIELVDGDGEVVRRTFSAFDGFFEMLEIPTGEYTLRAERRGEAASLDVSITIEDPYVDGVEMRLE